MNRHALAQLAGVTPHTLLKLQEAVLFDPEHEVFNDFPEGEYWFFEVKGAIASDTGMPLEDDYFYPSNFCVSVIEYYANQGCKTAQYAMQKFALMGQEMYEKQQLKDS